MTKVVSEVEGFKYTTSIKKLRKLKKRIRVVPGGSSAGKTFSILPILIDQAIKNKGLEVSVVSESIPHLRKGAIKDFLKILKATNRYNDKQWNRTLLTYYFSNGSYIEFFSADQEDKVRGPRRNVLYINECNNLKFDTYHQLAIRTSHNIWLDFNPSHEFWVYQELKEQDDDDVEWLTLTYKDNEGLPDSIVKELEKAMYKGYHNPHGNLNDESNIKDRYWANWWKVYGLGQLGSLEGVIFSNWDTIKEVPKGARYVGTGLDFGYTNDPSAIVDVYEWNGKRIVDLVLYAKKQSNDMLYEALRTRSREVWADSAEPKSIDYLFNKGINCKPVIKGADSIKYGIDLMQEQEYLITESSVELIKEVRFYQWGVDKYGATLNKPATGQADHAIDAWRYCEMMTLSPDKGVDLEIDFF